MGCVSRDLGSSEASKRRQVPLSFRMTDCRIRASSIAFIRETPRIVNSLLAVCCGRNALRCTMWPSYDDHADRTVLQVYAVLKCNTSREAKYPLGIFAATIVIGIASLVYFSLSYARIASIIPARRIVQRCWALKDASVDVVGSRRLFFRTSH